MNLVAMAQPRILGKNCGSGGAGSPGFQPGNTCARGSGGGIDRFRKVPEGLDVGILSGDFQAVSKAIFKGDTTPEEVAAMAGAGPNSQVKIRAYDKGDKGLMVSFLTPGPDGEPYIKGERMFGIDKAGNTYLKNNEFYVETSHHGQGIGTKMLAQQVAWAQEKGVSTIYTTGSTGSGMNGAYTWARLGYDAPLAGGTDARGVSMTNLMGRFGSAGQHLAYSTRDPAVKQRIEEITSKPDARVSDIMKDPVGREWWKPIRHDVSMQFDTSPDSLSYQVLNSYLDERASQGRAVKRAKAKNCGSGAAGSPGFQPGNTCARGRGSSSISDFGELPEYASINMRTSIDPGVMSRLVGIDTPEEMVVSYGRSIIGKTIDNDPQTAGRQLAALSGAPPGSEIQIQVTPDGELSIDFNNRGHSFGNRTIQRSVETGKPEIYNELYAVNHKHRGKGESAKMLAMQVAHARQHKIGEIRTFAVGDQDITSSNQSNGAYTWPRMGYDGPVGRVGSMRIENAVTGLTDASVAARGKLAALMDGKGDNIRTSDLMKDPDTRKWWKDNFYDVDVSFDTRAGSQSSQVLEEYLTEKGISTTKSISDWFRYKAPKNCGSGAAGSPGFQPGNTCARGSGSGGGAPLQFGSAKEAVEYARENFNSLKFALSGVDDEMAGEIVNAVMKVQEMYQTPQIGRFLTKKLDRREAGRYETRILDSHSNFPWRNGNRPVSPDVVLNKQWVASKDTFTDTMGRVRSGYMQQKTVEDLVLHEMGHAMQYLGVRDHSRAEAMFQTHRKNLRKVSTYAAYDEHEALSESLVLYHKKGRRGLETKGLKDYADYIEEHFVKPEYRRESEFIGPGENQTGDSLEDFQALFKAPKNCGSGAAGSPGFQPGNTCARGGSGGGVPEFKSVGEAEKWASGKLATNVDFSNCKDPKVANRIVQTMGELQGRFKKPPMVDTLEVYKPSAGDTRAEQSGAMVTVFQTASRGGEYKPSYVSMGFNAVVWESQDAYREAMAPVSPDWLFSKSPKHAVAHEYGHVLDTHFGDQKLSQRLFEKHRKDLPIVGGYAAADRKEAVAELFAIYQAQGADSLSNLGGVDFSGYADYFKRFEADAKSAKSKNCGSGFPGRPGFQPGNTCARGGSGGLINQFAQMPKDLDVGLGYNTGRVGLQRFMKDHLGMDVPREEVAEVLSALAGAPDGASVTVAQLGDNTIGVRFSSHGGEVNGTRRIVASPRAGKVMIHNSSFYVESPQQGKGIGTKMLAQQVAWSRKLGVNTIETAPAGDAQETDGYNGSYTWPRMGYDGSFTNVYGGVPKLGHWARHAATEPVLAAKLKEVEKKIKSGTDVKMSDFMKDRHLRSWWKKNYTDINSLEFDVAEGSVSSRVLEGYLKEKEYKARGGTLPADAPMFAPAPKSKSAVPIPKKPKRAAERFIEGDLSMLVPDPPGLSGNLKNCGSGASGSPGFQPGNTCARGSGSAGDSVLGYRIGGYMGGWQDTMTDDEQNALQKFFGMEYQWIRPLQKGDDPDIPAAVGTEVTEETKAGIASGAIKAGQVYEGETIMSPIPFGYTEETWPHARYPMIEKGQKVVAITHGVFVYVEPNSAQVANFKKSHSYNMDRLREEHADKQWMIPALQGALDKAPKYEGTVYRAIQHENLNADIYMANWREGGTFTMKADSSATTDLGLAQKYTKTQRYWTPGDPFAEEDLGKGIMMKVKTRTAADVREANPQESEVMLRKGTKYRINKIDEYYVELEEMPGMGGKQFVGWYRYQAPKNCGSGASGSPGFQPGNTCNRFSQSSHVDAFGGLITPGKVTLMGSQEEFMSAAGNLLKNKPKDRLEAESRLATLAGAPEGSDVKFVVGSSNNLIIEFGTDAMEGAREISKRNGEVSIKNHDFVVFGYSNRGKGLGTKMLAQQVARARQEGVSKIHVMAVGTASPGRRADVNGAYTWARLGYDGSLEMASPRALRTLQREVAAGTHPAVSKLKKIADNATTAKISDFMKDPDTRKWWKENFSSWSGEFDTAHGSQSSRVLGAYLQEKGITPEKDFSDFLRYKAPKNCRQD